MGSGGVACLKGEPLPDSRNPLARRGSSQEGTRRHGWCGELSASLRRKVPAVLTGRERGQCLHRKAS